MSATLEVNSVRVSERTVWTFVSLISNGLRGVGEATLEGQSTAVEHAIESLRGDLLERLAADGRAALRWLQGCAVGTDRVNATAVSGIEQALQDLLAQQAARPLHEMFGGGRRASIPLYANINRGTVPRTPEQFATRALRAASQGFRGIKLAPFDGVTPGTASEPQGRALIDAGLARVAAVREALRPAHRDVAIMVDCHWRFDEPAARAMVRELAALEVRWYECPVPEETACFPLIRSLRSMANAAGMQLAGAETMTGCAGFEPILAHGLYDVVMPDVKHCGGLAEMLRIAELAQRRGVACSPHNPTGPICHAHSLHMASLIEDMPCLEVQFEESEQFHRLADQGLPRFRDGMSALPSGPGLGVGLHLDSIAGREVP